MSYQVLARKWRPRTFQDMVGQEHILRMLTNALEQNRIHHAYLFTGTRGVGKTTLARILSKCLNCEEKISAIPCGTCAACTAIDSGQFIDLFEVDAASKTKVEDTRDLLENVLYPPTHGRFKIYLIDEVHMLSNHSFNALLKTLEEPPAHVKFLLATTDPKKLPITILSRCLQFHLKRITPEQIAKHLQHVCETEKIIYEQTALDKLATAADGSMRDALSILDQAIAYGEGKVKHADVYSMLGSMAQEDVLPLLEALATQDGEALFAYAKQLSERAPDFQQLLEEVIQLLHRTAIAQVVTSENSEATIQSLAKQFSAEEIQLYYQIALLGRRDIALTPSPQQGFEMTLLRMLAFKPQIGNFSQPTPDILQTPVITGDKPEWRVLLPKLGLSGMAFALAANCTLKSLDAHKVVLALSVNHQPMLNAKLQERIEEALSKELNQKINLEIKITSEELVTPIKQQQTEKNARLAGAKESLLQDPKIKELIDMYDATLEVSLVT